MSKALDIIGHLIETFNPDKDTELHFAEQVREAYLENGEPEDCREQYAAASGYIGQAWFWAWDGIKQPGYHVAFISLLAAYHNGNKGILEELGLCYYKGCSTPDGSPEKDKAMALWKEGMDLGDKRCALRYCAERINDDEADPDDIDKLIDIASDPEAPEADACALLYLYFSQEGEEDLAWDWREKAQELESPLMQSLLEEKKEEEIGEDDWHPKTDMSMFFGNDEEEEEFDGYDDETEGVGALTGYPEVGEKYVIIAATDNSFRIVQADAANWGSLPALIGADRCDTLRCEKFRQVSHHLMLSGTLLGLLDRDAFRKSYLKLNWHASQWYDGHADLSGALIICLEDAQYHPFSFPSKAQAQCVIDALLNSDL